MVKDFADAGHYIFYRDRPEWKDVTPIKQDDAERLVVKIAYSEKFTDAHDYLRAVMAVNEMTQRAFDLTTDVVQLNSANYTVWEYRRQLLRHLHLDLDTEFRFIDPIIEENCKNYQVWHHREWTCKERWERAKKDFTNESEDQITLKKKNHGNTALSLLKIILNDDSKNYHAWQHRHWIWTFFGTDNEEELLFTKKLLKDDVFCNSAWSHRFAVVQKEGLSDEILEREINLAKSFAKKAPSNESVWNYIYGLLTPLPQVVAKEAQGNFTNNKVNVELQQINPPSPALVKMKDFFTELAAEKPEVNDSPAALGFLFEVLFDNLVLKAKGDKESIETLLSEVLELSDRLHDEVDRIRASYWAYRKRQAERLCMTQSTS